MMEVDYVEKTIAEIRSKGIELGEDGADRLRAMAHADDLELFWIINTSGRKAYFLARSSRLARQIAVAVNHIQALENGECYRANEGFFRNQPAFGSSVKRAIADRVPGKIVPKGNHAMIGEKIFSPLSAVPK